MSSSRESKSSKALTKDEIFDVALNNAIEQVFALIPRTPLKDKLTAGEPFMPAHSKKKYKNIEELKSDSEYSTNAAYSVYQLLLFTKEFDFHRNGRIKLGALGAKAEGLALSSSNPSPLGHLSAVNPLKPYMGVPEIVDDLTFKLSRILLDLCKKVEHRDEVINARVADRKSKLNDNMAAYNKLRDEHKFAQLRTSISTTLVLFELEITKHEEAKKISPEDSESLNLIKQKLSEQINDYQFYDKNDDADGFLKNNQWKFNKLMQRENAVPIESPIVANTTNNDLSVSPTESPVDASNKENKDVSPTSESDIPFQRSFTVRENLGVQTTTTPQTSPVEQTVPSLSSVLTQVSDTVAAVVTQATDQLQGLYTAPAADTADSKRSSPTPDKKGSQLEISDDDEDYDKITDSDLKGSLGNLVIPDEDYDMLSDDDLESKEEPEEDDFVMLLKNLKPRGPEAFSTQVAAESPALSLSANYDSLTLSEINSEISKLEEYKLLHPTLKQEMEIEISRLNELQQKLQQSAQTLFTSVTQAYTHELDPVIESLRRNNRNPNTPTRIQLIEERKEGVGKYLTAEIEKLTNASLQKDAISIKKSVANSILMLAQRQEFDIGASEMITRAALRFLSFFGSTWARQNLEARVTHTKTKLFNAHGRIKSELQLDDKKEEAPPSSPSNRRS